MVVKSGETLYNPYPCQPRIFSFLKLPQHLYQCIISYCTQILLIFLCPHCPSIIPIIPIFTLPPRWPFIAVDSFDQAHFLL